MNNRQLEEIFARNKWPHMFAPFLYGLRTEATPDAWNDILGICMEDGTTHEFVGSTDPGIYWTEHPFNNDGLGCAHMRNGFHDRCWQVGIHAPGTSFAHEALIQVGDIEIWRDKNKTFRFEPGDPIQKENWFGIDFHWGGNAPQVGMYSAGCQVIQDLAQFKQFMDLVKSTSYYRENPHARFSYALIQLD